MKMTMTDGTVFEGTLKEYAELVAFAETQQAINEAKEAEQLADTVEFEGEQYRKVDRKAQAGDVVVLTGDDLPNWFTKGKAYKVNGNSEITDDAEEFNNYDIYSEQYGRTPETVDVYEKVEAEYVPQEGDIVVVTTEGTHDFRKGDIVKIDRIVSFGGNPFIGKLANKDVDHPYLFNREFRKAKPAEVEAYEKAVADVSKPKLKAGDFVKFEEPDLYDITVGKIYEVQTDDDGDLCIIDDVGDEDYSYLAEFAIKIDADDVKWAKIGRTKDEYKVGDIVEITEDCCGAKVGEIVKVSRVSDDRDGSTRIYYAHHEGALGFTAHYGTYKLIATVESTLN